MSARDELIEIVTGHPESSGGDAVWATDLVDTHRAEVLAEADLLPKADVVAWLVKEAREGTPVEQLASKVARGAIRPDNLRMLPAKFFEVGRTYTEPGDVTDWRFRCDAITTHPADGERTALGWRHFRGEWSEYAYGEGDFEIHQIADAIGTTEQGDSK